MRAGPAVNGRRRAGLGAHAFGQPLVAGVKQGTGWDAPAMAVRFLGAAV